MFCQCLSSYTNDYKGEGGVTRDIYNDLTGEISSAGRYPETQELEVDVRARTHIRGITSGVRNQQPWPLDHRCPRLLVKSLYAKYIVKCRSFKTFHVKLLAIVIYKIIYQLFLIVIYSSAPWNVVGRRAWRYQKGVTRIRISKKNINPFSSWIYGDTEEIVHLAYFLVV